MPFAPQTLLVAAALLGSGCTARAVRPSVVLVLNLDNKSAAPARLSIDSIEIEIAGALKTDLAVCTRLADGAITSTWGDVPDTSAPGAWFRGHPIEIADGRLRIGDDFGDVATGTPVLIDADGVHVAGQLRGALPR